MIAASTLDQHTPVLTSDYFQARLAEIGVNDAQAFERLLGLIETGRT